MEEDYREKYRTLKRKFKAMQSEHLKLSEQFELSLKTVKSLQREKR